MFTVRQGTNVPPPLARILSSPFCECIGNYGFYYKRYASTMACCSGAMFRFHTGSIKSFGMPNVSEAIPLFRFHTGSIKRLSLLPRVLPFFRFDSILVRLKGCVRCFQYVANSCFDSILVRLKGSYQELCWS